VAEGWAFLEDAVTALAKERDLSPEDALKAIRDDLEHGRRDSEAICWEDKEAVFLLPHEPVYLPVGDSREFQPLSPGFWITTGIQEAAGRAEVSAKEVISGSYRYQPIRVSALREQVADHTPTVQEKEPQATNRGRHLKSATVRCWIEIVDIAASRDGLPDDREELMSHIVDFNDMLEKPVGRSTLRAMVAAVYERPNPRR
jgi:hypothetical protein